MPRIHLLAIAVLALASTAATAQDKPAPKKLYCWDENGRRVCADALPAEAAARTRAEISAKSGRQLGTVLSPEQRAAADAAALAAARAAETEAARLRREHAMAQAYDSEADLLRSFEDRVALLEETVKASALGVSNLRLSLVGLLRQAGELELAARPVPAALAANIATQHTELRRRERMLVQQRAARSALDGEQERVLQRYRELKSPAPAPGG
jgi:hypothetical protein